MTDHDQTFFPTFSVRRLAASALATQPRRRMAAVAGGAMVFWLFASGMGVALPLWWRATGHESGEYAALHGARMLGAAVIVTFMGAFSDRIGQRRLSILCMLAVAGLLLLMSSGATLAVWLIIPVYGGLMSVTFVGMNSLVQRVSVRRPGLANSLYRAVAAAAAIAAPLLATAVAGRFGGYPVVFGLYAVFCVVAALALSRYPGEQRPPRIARPGVELRRLLRGYVEALRSRRLLVFTLVMSAWLSSINLPLFLAPFYFTDDLKLQDVQFGWLVSAGGVGMFLATVVGAAFMDRFRLKVVFGVLTVLSAACALALSRAQTVALSCGCYLALTSVRYLAVSPMCMWLSRAAGNVPQARAFSVQKIISTLTVAGMMLAVVLLRQTLELRTVFLVFGGVALALSIVICCLPEPPVRTQPVPEDDPDCEAV